MNDLLQVIRNDDVGSVRLIGELDASNAEALLDDLGPQLAEGASLTLDLTELSFIDSMGLRTLLRAAAALGSHGRLVLHGPQRAVARTFELVGLEKVSNIEVGGASDT
ncbi:MAG: STAS domain-containing protein [Actinomycetota bacterium]